MRTRDTCHQLRTPAGDTCAGSCGDSSLHPDAAPEATRARAAAGFELADVLSRRQRLVHRRLRGVTSAAILPSWERHASSDSCTGGGDPTASASRPLDSASTTLTSWKLLGERSGRLKADDSFPLACTEPQL